MSNHYYFYDMNGKQIESNLNGKMFSSMGEWIPALGGRQSRFGNLISRFEISYFSNVHLCESKKITIDDFPGYENVIVKEWCPDIRFTEYSILTKKPDGFKGVDD